MGEGSSLNREFVVGVGLGSICFMASASSRPLALITGASVGIGYELAKVFATRGFDLVLTSRSKEAMEKVAQECPNVQTYVLPADLADPASPAELFEEIQALGRPLDVLVNNAGFGSHGKFWENDVAMELAMIQVNISALVHLTRLFLPGMVQRRGGRVLNVASTAAFQGGPLMAVYYASKAFVLHFSEAIDAELRGTGVTVTALCPGPTATEFQKRAGVSNSKLFNGRVMSAARVAQIGFDATMAGKRVAVAGVANLALVEAVRLVPRKFVSRVVEKLNRNR
jgi:uncharacterized protein